ncbi:MAG: hypothetical protein ACR2LE_08915 [Nocardioidaceae bacterium]
MAKGRPSKSGKARSAITGHYVTKQTAVRHPRTTVVEGKKKYCSKGGIGSASIPPGAHRAAHRVEPTLAVSRMRPARPDDLALVQTR